MDSHFHPTLLSGCSLAATTKEAQFRVNYPNSRGRASRIFALDQIAAEAMYAIVDDPWNGAHFITVVPNQESIKSSALALSNPDGTATNLATELDGADIAILIASDGNSAGAAEAIARFAFERKIMIVGLALAKPKAQLTSETVVSTLRQFASVLVVAEDETFIPAMLTALRA